MLKKFLNLKTFLFLIIWKLTQSQQKYLFRGGKKALGLLSWRGLFFLCWSLDKYQLLDSSSISYLLHVFRLNSLL
ncbi:hypothetical protein HanPSC8_Chr16g0728081 [Helianthus annuus]|nr:hypothetical protein HanPSC8_Chr16g0728081 [Helianthus annuus]